MNCIEDEPAFRVGNQFFLDIEQIEHDGKGCIIEYI
jgi:hypothetical protein